MKSYLLSAASCALLLPQALAAAVDSPQDIDQVIEAQEFADLVERATPQGPDGYVPSSVPCPDTRPSIRSSAKDILSPQEKEWLPRRRKQTISHIQDFLKRIAIPDFDSESYLRNVNASSDALPNIGIAVSGGGYRAMLNGAGAVAAFDSRSEGSTSKGNLGGLLQSATYLSGLSGGGWLVGSIYTNNFSTVHDAANSKRVWQFDNSILQGPGDIVDLVKYYTTIIHEVDEKHDAGFDRTITDYWGRMLSYQLVDADQGGPGFTFSSIADDPDFSSAGSPLPILVSDSRAPGKKNTSLSDTLFEFNPWELGSFDPALQGFAPLKYVGSNFTDGKLPSDGKCIAGFDNTGYVMGTSSTLFNAILLQLNGTYGQSITKDVPKILIDGLVKVLTDLAKDGNDVAAWEPNPFRGFNDKFDANGSNELTLVDGGEDNQNIPFHPHTVEARKVDVVFAVDSTDDNGGWPEGSSPMNTYRRSLLPVANGTGFPSIPGMNTFLNLELNTRPTFFGCNASNTSTPAPLVVYLPNYPYVYLSNTSTFTLSYTDSERDAMIENGWAVATQLNGTRDKEWDVCVGCAVLSRSWDRTGTKAPGACGRCFERYCWNGTVDESAPKGKYEPSLFSNHPVNVTKEDGAPARGAVSGVVMVSLAAMLMVSL